MEFACRICKDKFSVTKVLSDSAVVSEGFSVVSTQCGHLFHWKCLEGVLTNQKLLHARHGTGPLRRFCPVVRCNANIPSDESIIRISFNDDAHTANDGNEETNYYEDTEGKLVKRVQTLMLERYRLVESLEKAEAESEIYRVGFERVKLDLADLRSFLKDDYQIRKGDLIFWVTRDGMHPGKILEIRKKPGEKIHYAIVKLDNKTKVPGVGPYAVNRDTLILPVSDLLTFKSFFSGFFDKFQAAFEALRVDLNSEIQDVSSPTGSQSSAERNAAYYRSTRKISRSTSKSSLGASILNPLDELDSELVESVPAILSKNSTKTPTSQNSTKIIRSKTIHYGAGNEPRRMEKCRSMSWVTPPTSSMDSPESESSRIGDSLKLEESSSNSLVDLNDSEDDTREFIREGERVIWFDTYSEYQQLGTVASVCEYSPCAIVKFDEHPVVKHKFQYRTIQLDELFPYDLASPEDKFKIAESYGKVGDFVDNRRHLFSIANEEVNSDGENEQEN